MLWTGLAPYRRAEPYVWMARTPVATQSLFNRKTLTQALNAVAFHPASEQVQAARAWAERARDPVFAREKEVALQGLFKSEIVERVLGYRPFASGAAFTVVAEHPAGAGSVDLALGHFDAKSRRVLAPFELKGPKTRDLDAIMPGRAKSPVQQAWDYATDLPGSKWVLVSNLLEVRLYAFGHGRSSCERFDLARLDEPEELKRLWFLLGADNLLSGSTAGLLDRSARADRTITDQLYADYKTLRDRLIDAVDEGHPTLGRTKAIEHAQTILDRVLFIAFAEDTGLLPAETIRNALAQQNPFVATSLWDIFKGLFRAIDQGHATAGIPAYNGGLFAPHPELDVISLSDDLCRAFEALASYDFESDVSVEVLGHIFEQSITDIEAMQAKARGEEPPTATKKKREGVVYTPTFVTRFIVEETIGRTLAERFAAILPRYARGKGQPAPGVDIVWRSSKAEREFWEAYQDALRTLTVVDPACGSGAFLIAAFDFLAAEYRRVNERLADLTGGKGVTAGQLRLFDPDREILTHNLFGVDVNAASVEITKLSLWIKTAKRGKALDSLEGNIRVGNSLIENADFHHRAFVWRDAFPAIFEEGGFDIVLGNPPYVRMELIKPFKPYLEKRFEVVADRADLYAYFFEQGVRLLKPGTGRLGYISSSTFFRTGSGTRLRRFLSNSTAIEDVVDFGDLQLFEGVTTYPAILTLRRRSPGESATGELRFKVIRDRVPVDLSAVFRSDAVAMERSRLNEKSWTFDGATAADLREKLRQSRETLGAVYGAPLRGIVTGLNDAFIVPRTVRDRLVADDPRAVDLLKPFLKGENIKRWRIESDDLFLINTPKGKIDIEHYPSVRDHLAPFRSALEARATKQGWFELQQAQLAYQSRFAEPKIIYGHFASERIFCFDEDGLFPNDKGYAIPGGDHFLLALLNSKLEWFLLNALAPAVRGGFHEMRVQYVEVLPIPEASPEDHDSLGRLARRCQTLAAERHHVRVGVRGRIPDLCPPERNAKLSTKLNVWWELDFAAFRAEVKRVFKQDIPLAERNAWETYLRAEGDKVRRLTSEIADAEREIDRVVYRLFDLTPDEIALIDDTASPAGVHEAT
nr:N-6 DNA methylase [Methylobacterium sp. L1A1]